MYVCICIYVYVYMYMYIYIYPIYWKPPLVGYVVFIYFLIFTSLFLIYLYRYYEHVVNQPFYDVALIVLKNGIKPPFFLLCGPL